jgi:hypothetical protein
MAVEPYEGTYGRTVTIDVCHACNGLWFDGRESLLLAPAGVIALFQSMHERHATARAPLVPGNSCPRCGGRLKETSDLMNGTRFSYLGCPSDGRFITFFQWLREKGFVRTPSPVELAELKARVKQVNCSQCSAPIDLATANACAHCQAPVSVLSEDRISQTLEQLSAKQAERDALKPARLAEAMMLKHHIDHAWRREERAAGLRRTAAWGLGFRADPIDIGLGLLLRAFRR